MICLVLTNSASGSSTRIAGSPLFPMVSRCITMWSLVLEQIFITILKLLLGEFTVRPPGLWSEREPADRAGHFPWSLSVVFSHVSRSCMASEGANSPRAVFFSSSVQFLPTGTGMESLQRYHLHVKIAVVFFCCSSVLLFFINGIFLLLQLSCQFQSMKQLNLGAAFPPT